MKNLQKDTQYEKFQEKKFYDQLNTKENIQELYEKDALENSMTEKYQRQTKFQVWRNL